MKKGDIILIKFPFTNNLEIKLRPALVLVSLEGKDLIVARITTQNKEFQKYSLKLEKGILRFDSFIKLDHITTLEKNKVIRELGKISKQDLLNLNIKLKEILNL